MKRLYSHKWLETNKKTKEGICVRSSENKERVVRDGSGEEARQLNLIKIKILVFASRTIVNNKKIEVKKSHSHNGIFQTTVTAVRRMSTIGNGGK